MRKIFSLLAAVLFAGSMMAAEAIMQYTGGVTANMVGDGANNAATLGLDEDLFTVLADKGANQNLPGLNKNNDIRLYADKNSGNGNTITVSIASGTITSIVLDIKQTATFVVKAGETAVTEEDGAYAINATSFSIQNTTTGATTQLQLNKITITYESGDVPPTPTMDYYVAGSMTNWGPMAAYKLAANPANEGEYMGEFTFAANDEFKVGYSDGTTIESTNYFPNGIDNNYVITEAGDYTVYFRPDGQGGEDWHEGYINAVKKEAPAAISCLEVYQKAKNDVVLLNPVTVTYSNGANVWVMDGSASMLIYLPSGFTNNFQAGDTLSGISGVVDIYQNIVYEVKPDATQAAAIVATPGEAPAPSQAAVIEASDVNKYVILPGFSIEGEFTTDSKTSLSAVLGENTVTIYNNFKFAYTFEAGKTYDIIGVVSAYKGNPQVYFISAEEVVAPVNTYTVAGNLADLFGSAWDPEVIENDMLPIVGGEYTHAWGKESVLLEAGNVLFKVCENHGWDVAYPEQNYELAIAENAIYNVSIFFNAETKAVYAEAQKVGDAPQPADVWDEIVFTEVAAAGVFNDSIFTVEGSEFSLKCVDTENSKLKTTSNNASFGSLDERHDYTIRLQTSGKSNSKNNMELNIPADGKLRIAVRTGSSSDLTRTLVLAQGNDTICNKILLDTDTVPGASSPKIFNFIYVDVKAGKVAVTYPVNAINFYAFAFKADVVPPTPEHTYTVAGGSDVLFGTTWDPTNTANDMALVEGLYTWEKSELTLAAGNILFKVCEDHAWTTAYPAQNYELNIPEAGIYTITITFDPANDNAVNAVATKTGEAEVDPTVSIAGSMNGWNVSADMMTLAEDKLTASLALNLDAANYTFKVVLNGSDWRSNAQQFTRENASAANMTGNESDMSLVADVAGEYVFTWTFADNSLAITYPEAPVVPDTIVIDIESEVQYVDYVAEAGYWQFMAENDEYEISLSNNYTTQAAGVYTIADLDEDYTYVYIKADLAKVHFVDGEFTLTEGEDGSRSIEGVMTGDDGNIYNIKLVYRIPTAETTVNVEIPEWGIYDGSEYYGIASYVFAGEAADGTYVQIVIPGTNPVGQFTYDDVYARGTGIEVAGNYQGIYSMNINISVDEAQNAIITADILCYNNTLYHVTTIVGQGVDNIDAAVKAIKRIVNGQVVIEKAGKTYNMNGAVIR